MSSHARTAEKLLAVTAAPARNNLVQRKCACGGSASSGDCKNCEKEKLGKTPVTSRWERDLGSRVVHPEPRSPGQPLDQARNSFTGDRFGHDFSRIQIHSAMPAAQDGSARSVSVDGVPASGSLQGPNEVSINGPGGDPKQKPASPAAAPKLQTPPAKAGPSCPPDLKVAGVFQMPDKDFGKDGWLTGWGGYAVMEVSDPSSQKWDGTEVHENVRLASNTCGHLAKDACSNKSGEGGSAGSIFKVGGASNFAGLAPLAAKANKFYDVHAFSTKEASILHKLDKLSCAVQCEQSYDCGGKRLGPDYLITYTMKQDQIAKYYDVTRVEFRKAEKAKPAAAPAAPAGGSKP